MRDSPGPQGPSRYYAFHRAFSKAARWPRTMDTCGPLSSPSPSLQKAGMRNDLG
ncbi:hypothetical protein C8T65DRAFT_628984 [Cerioporus squamosus]|nr:hypothetical protein C8T65DRAFT_628984 [Cerioporus squamosus]